MNYEMVKKIGEIKMGTNSEVEEAIESLLITLPADRQLVIASNILSKGKLHDTMRMGVRTMKEAYL